MRRKSRFRCFFEDFRDGLFRFVRLSLLLEALRDALL